MGLSVICAKSLIVSKAVAHIICDIYDPDRHGDRLLPTTAKPTTHKQRSRMTVESTSSAPNNLSTVHEHQQTKNVPLAIMAAGRGHIGPRLDMDMHNPEQYKPGIEQCFYTPHDTNNTDQHAKPRMKVQPAQHRPECGSTSHT
jgi:hypothetical protein